MKRREEIGRSRLKDDLKPELNEKAEIRSIIEAERPNIELLNGQLAKNYRQLHIAVRGRLLDKERLQPLLSQRAQIEAELIAVRERLKNRIYTALTLNERVAIKGMRSRR